MKKYIAIALVGISVILVGFLLIRSGKTNKEVAENISVESASIVEVASTDNSNGVVDASSIEVSEEPVKEIEDDSSNEVSIPAETASASEASSEEKVEETNGVTKFDEAKTMYAVKNCNVRKEPDKDSEQVSSLTAGQEIKVTGKTDTDWYEVELNDGVCFVKSSLLSDSKPQTASNNNTQSNQQTEQVQNTQPEQPAPIQEAQTSNSDIDKAIIEAAGGCAVDLNSLPDVGNTDGAIGDWSGVTFE